MPLDRLTLPLSVGLIGTGFAAKLRAEAFQADPRTQLVAVVGHTPERTEEFAQTYGIKSLHHWQDLIALPEIDLVVVSTINRDHGAIAKAALTARKHLIVEYPLSLDFSEAQHLLTLSQQQQRLLHIEHIELLGGLHQALRQTLPQLGELSYLRYSKINPKHPAPERWSYNPTLFGFPLIGSLSCVHRLTDILGTVTTVSAHNRYWPDSADNYRGCLCTARLTFTQGAIAEITYGKGEIFWQTQRQLEVHGNQGTLIFAGDYGSLIQGNHTTDIPVGDRRGLFAQDTRAVLDYLTDGTPLYVTPEASLYALQIASAAQHSAATQTTVIFSHS